MAEPGTVPFTTADLVTLLQLRRTSDFSFTGVSPLRGTPRVYGGQMIAQSVMAAGQTVDQNRLLHSMHGYFLEPGDIQDELFFDVEPTRDGNHFSVRSVTVQQKDKTIFTGFASFQLPEGDGHRRLQAMPAVSEPRSLEAEQDFVQRQRLAMQSPTVSSPFFMSLFERRSADWRRLFDPGARAPRNSIWCRLRDRVDVPPLMHHALIAYISDMDLMSTAMRPRGVAGLDKGFRAASLDHAMWFHAGARADDWFYYDLDGPCAIHNRGLGIGAIYQNGERVITTAQEGLLRSRSPD